MSHALYFKSVHL